MCRRERGKPDTGSVVVGNNPLSSPCPNPILGAGPCLSLWSPRSLTLVSGAGRAWSWHWNFFFFLIWVFSPPLKSRHLNFFWVSLSRSQREKFGDKKRFKSGMRSDRDLGVAVGTRVSGTGIFCNELRGATLTVVVGEGPLTIPTLRLGRTCGFLQLLAFCILGSHGCVWSPCPSGVISPCCSRPGGSPFFYLHAKLISYSELFSEFPWIWGVDTW